FFADAAVATAFVHSLKLWIPAPPFVTLKVIRPAGSFENFDSLKASSVGLPMVTLTMVNLGTAAGFTVELRARAAGADPAPTAVSSTTAAQTARPRPSTRSNTFLVDISTSLGTGKREAVRPVARTPRKALPVPGERLTPSGDLEDALDLDG